MARKPPKPPKPTAAELDLLRTVWRVGPATVKEIHQLLLKDRPSVTYATVLRLMQVMHAKGLLLRDESERSHVYAAAHAQDLLRSSLLTELIQKAFAGSVKDLVLAALDGHVSNR
jgi:predicted transcriptional regulator